MKGITLFCVFALCFSLLTAALPAGGEIELYDRIVRLHVIANSDSDEDQTLKLGVRDAVLAEMDNFISADASFEQAVEIISASKSTLLDVCKTYIASSGYDYDCDIALGVEEYPARVYEGVSLPAGRYYSVRVLIGQAAGENWWCVLFPPLCLGAAEPKEELVQAGLTPDEVNILTDNEDGEYVLKFKLLEFFNEVFATGDN